MKKKLLFFILTCLVVLSTFGATKEYVKIETEKTDNGYIIYASNSHFIPYTIVFKFPKLTNLESSVPLPHQAVIPPGTDKMELLRLTISNEKESYGYRSSYRTIMGDPAHALHDDDYLYTIPFRHGTKHKLGQGFHGKATHTDVVNAYAVDFNMDVGTPICAARDGIVVETKEDSQIGGPHMNYADDANLITIYHDDGTFASYVHLKYNGVAVEVGERVKTGQVIGYSGNTGRSSGPHLHFSISLPDNAGSFRSIPFKFLYENGEAVVPEEGKYYYSFHTGGEDFIIESAESMKNEDYEEHSEKVKKTDKVSFRSETVDDTVILYIVNGYDSDFKLKVTMKLQNLKASKELPIILEVPAQTEKYLVFLQPINPAGRTSYSASISQVR